MDFFSVADDAASAVSGCIRHPSHEEEKDCHHRTQPEPPTIQTQLTTSAAGGIRAAAAAQCGTARERRGMAKICNWPCTIAVGLYEVKECRAL